MRAEWRRRVAWVAVVVLTACDGDALGPNAGQDILLSEAMSLPSTTEATFTWVSLPPGTVPDGLEATVTTRRGTGTVTVPVVEGGFDPVALQAGVGDTAIVEVRGATGLLATVTLAVPRRTPPVVVRTYPPKKRKDVPLNLNATIVFSEPMDPKTITSSTIRLLRGGQPVAGTVILNAWKAQFVPTVPLARSANYVLQVTTGARDLSGDPLGEGLSVDFTTAAAPTGAVARVEVTPSSATLLLGGTLRLAARTADGLNRDLYRLVSWRTSDSLVARVTWDGTVTASGTGEATITATADGVTGSAQIRVASAVALGVGAYHTCAINPDGQTWCWGNDYAGHLGVPPNDTCNFLVNGDPSCLTEAKPLPGAPTFTSVAGGQFFTCGLTAAGGTAYCWGSGVGGNLGDGDTTRHVNTIPTPVAGGLVFNTLAAGAKHVCGLTAGGQAYCWGDNSVGQLGDGTQIARGEPVAVAGGHTFATISAWFLHTCGVDGEGRGWCWGDNTHGELGIGRTSGFESVPAAVDAPVPFATIDAGWAHTCGLTPDGTAYCWGSNGSVAMQGQDGAGALGTGSSDTSYVPTPTAVQTTLRFSQIDAGLAFTCGTGLADSTAYCWGVRYWEPYTDTGSWYSDLTPTAAAPVSGSRIAVLGLGNRHACGITSAGEVLCWGLDWAAQTRPFRRP